MKNRIYPKANCVVCGQEFPKTRIDRMCCSGTCSIKNSYKKNSYKKNSTAKTDKPRKKIPSRYVKRVNPQKPCLICGEIFNPKHCDTRFCSNKCKYAHAKEGRKQKARIIAMLDGRADRYENTPKQTKAKTIARNIAYKHFRQLEPCEVCSSTERLHRHHDDYSKPLQVRFLCCYCHNAWHKYNRAKF